MSGSPIKLPNDAGVRKFVPVMLTPYRTDGKVDLNTLSALTDFYLEAGAGGFFANCLSSEMYHLAPDERLSIARQVVKHVNGRMSVVASGSFGKDLAEQADFTKQMYHTGVNAVILITGHFADREKSDDYLLSQFHRFFELTDNIPLGTYECPSPYKRILSPGVYRELVNTNRLLYHKDTTLDTKQVEAKVIIGHGSRVELYDAHTPNASASLRSGAKGISAIAGNFYPELFAWLCGNINDFSKQDDVNWLQEQLTRMDSIISSGYPLSAKYFLSKRGVPFNLQSRSNTTPLTAAQINILDNFYKELPSWHERLGIKMTR